MKPLDIWLNIKDGRRGASVAILYQCQLRWQAADVLDVHSDKKWVISCLSPSQLELQPSRPSVVSVCLRLLKLASPQSLWHHMTNQQRHVLKQILGVWDLLYYTPLTTSSSGHHKLFILTASDPVCFLSACSCSWYWGWGHVTQCWSCLCLPNLASFYQDALTLMSAKKDMETFSLSFRS